jgi:hypothetical protein
MNKAQILILLILIVLVVYYFSQWEKSTQKPSSLLNKPPIINCPPALPSEIIERNSLSTTTMPLNLPNQEPVYRFPSTQFVEINPDDQYRQTMLALLADWLEQFTNLQQKSQITQVISLMQTENKARWEYLQALWSLKGLNGFEFYCGQSLAEWVSLPVPTKPNNEPLDTGWLTDDNLEFILRNSPRIQVALKQNKQFHLRTDIANVYNAFYQAKSKQAWDLAEFLQELEWNKALYTLFPLRVNGNHWGLFILAERGRYEVVNENIDYEPAALLEVYYTSSGGGSLAEEKKQLKPFIEQICGEGTEIKVILPADRESKGYDCGVYLVKYIEEVLETGKLKLKRQYTEADCQEFRWEWKERIGERWCLW